MRSASWSALGLVLASAGVLSRAAWSSPPVPVAAANLLNALPQPASNTATPHITLPTRSPTPPPTATATAPGPSRATDAPLPGTPTAGAVTTALPAAPGGPGAPARSAVPRGSGTATAAAPSGTSVIGPPALPAGGADGGMGGGTVTTGATVGSGPVAGADPAPGEVGPAGFVRVPVPDNLVRALWAATGSPRQGQGVVERFTEGRPGPWGVAPFYLLLLLLYAGAVVGVWRAVRRLGEDRAER